jgi:hypothetical protein
MFYVELHDQELARDAMVIPDEKEVAEYYAVRKQLDQMAADFREIITHPSYSLPFLQPGRLVKIKHGPHDFGWGVIINYQKRLPPKVSLMIILKIPAINRTPASRIDLHPKTCHHTSSTFWMYFFIVPQARQWATRKLSRRHRQAFNQ